MTFLPDLIDPPDDICLLLLAHAEQRWLARELVPHLRELERVRAISDAELGTVSEEQLHTSQAYLEVLWFDAGGRAAQTDAAFAKLDVEAGERAGESAGESAGGDDERRARLRASARHYYDALRVTRRELGARVSRLTRAQRPEELHVRRTPAGASPRLRASDSALRPAVAFDPLRWHAGTRRGGGARR